MYGSILRSPTPNTFYIGILRAWRVMQTNAVGKTGWRMSYTDRLAHVDLNTHPDNLACGQRCNLSLPLSNSLTVTQIGKPLPQITDLIIR